MKPQYCMNYARWRDAAHNAHVMGATRPILLPIVFPPASNASPFNSTLSQLTLHEPEAEAEAEAGAYSSPE